MIKGMRYRLEREKIIEYMALSVEDKLNWLEEANEFNRIALTDKEKEIQKMFLGKDIKE